MGFLANLKAAFSSEPYVRASSTNVQLIGSEAKSQPFNYQQAVGYYNSWIYAAANLNANAVASNPLRLFTRRRANKQKLFDTRPPSNKQRNYLYGNDFVQPSTVVMRKIAEFGEDWEEVTDKHPVLQLIQQSNAINNGFDMSVLRILYGELTGNSYFHVVLNQDLGIPFALYAMPSQWVEIVPDEKEFIKGYLYGASKGKRIMFPKDEVIHFKRPNPKDLYYGMGKLEAAWGVAMQNIATHEMDLALFQNHARPDMLAIFKGNASPDQIVQFKHAINEELRGTKQRGKFLAINADLELKPLSFPPKDMNGRDDVVEEIAAVFGVPVSMMKANDPNLASATAGYAAWRQTTILPLCRMDEETLNAILLPMYGIQDDAVLVYDNPVPSDKVFELNRHSSALASGWMTIDEVRVEQGLAPINAADSYQPLDMTGNSIDQVEQDLSVAPTQVVADAPVSNTALNGAQISSLVGIVTEVTAGNLPVDSAKAIAAASFPAIPSITLDQIFDTLRVKPPAPVAAEAPPIPKSLIPFAKDCKTGNLTANGCCEIHNDRRSSVTELWHKHFDAEYISQKGKLDKDTQRLVDAVDKTFRAQVLSVVKRLRNTTSPSEDVLKDIKEILDKNRWRTDIVEALSPFISKNIVSGIDQGISDLQKFDPRIPQTIRRADLEKYAKTETVRLARHIGDSVTTTTSVRIGDILKNGIADGKSNDVMASDVQDWALGKEDELDFTRQRAVTIARTESARAQSIAKSLAWESTNLVKGKKWLVAPDACPFCEAAAASFENGQDISQPFFAKGEILTLGNGDELVLDYDNVQAPPLHPNCRCDMLPVVADDFEELLSGLRDRASADRQEYLDKLND
jgi:HK97 family phage portal protein